MADPRIQFGDAIQPVASHGGGVYTLRSREATGVGSIRGTSQTRRDKKEDVDTESNNVEDRDIKTKQVFSGWKLLWLGYQSIGVIYGDIGTSPLYVYSSTFTEDPSYDDLLGALSLIIWALTIMVTIKYCLIILRADDEGEGGTFALFSLLSRYANIVRRDPREEQMIRMERHVTGELGRSAQKTRNLMERSRFMQWLLKIVGVFGVALVMSDGVLTPAQSVLGAIQGIEVVSPDITNATIIGVSCAILVVLFLIQPFGITKLASSFAPIVIVWLLFNAVFGIYNLARHDASVLKAFSPYFAGAYLVRNQTEGWKSLGGILLAFTGCEALFADLGAFTHRAVQLSWLGFAFPCLLLGYIGQAAYISDNRTAWTNPFYNTVPPGCFWPSLVVAILAAIVASQAMITAVFQLLSQIMKLSYFPQIRIVHTSKIFYGQLYIPIANWLLMIGTVVVTAVYNNTTNLGHAYGVCVILVTFLSTCMVALVALIVWRVPTVIVAFVWLIFALFDGVFLSAALTKVPEGAWFTLALAVVLSCIFILWRFGKEQQWKAEASDRFPPSHMIRAAERTNEYSRKLRLSPAFGGQEITRIDGMGIFFDKAGAPSTTPTVFIHFLQKFHAASDIIIFFHLRPLQIPTVPPEERYTVTRCYIGTEGDSKCPMPGTYRLTIRHGYNDEVISENLGLLLYEQTRNYMIREGVDVKSTEPEHVNHLKETVFEEKAIDSTRPSFEQPDLAAKLAELQRAFSSQVVYVVGKEQMRVKPGTNIVRRILLELFLWIRDNTRSKVQALNIAVDKLVEVGFVKEV
ncbi:potassium uptake protein [Rhinocladiella mackenziei CBS 650.93]|uniref:Rhinocladiella mackenziei CBS 650.93 unplaced genomic scaffold supercont1.9, whole genome shotgun sequence n=1 Tax=Rhinocladiella mackenziei CBS 650.93 TaxID=1442369 RepID=A0A0D2GQB0_9EURO|nr:potassium uptake protein [Rhinocladiella mackenziei CBS 650.93]KIX00483.1 potassium uptake protein [Rhinocladiella mackenziei CBS 650.93]